MAHPAIVRIKTPDGDTFIFGPYEKVEAEALSKMATRKGSDFEGCEAEAESLATFAHCMVDFGPEVRVGHIVKFDPTGRDLVDQEIHGRVVSVDLDENGQVDCILVVTGQGERMGISVTRWELAEGFDLLMSLHAEGEDTLIGQILDLADWGCSLYEAWTRVRGAQYVVLVDSAPVFRGTLDECQMAIDIQKEV